MSQPLEDLLRETKAKRPDIVREIDDLMAVAATVGPQPMIDKAMERMLVKLGNSTDPDDRKSLEDMAQNLRKMMSALNKPVEAKQAFSAFTLLPTLLMVAAVVCYLAVVQQWPIIQPFLGK